MADNKFQDFLREITHYINEKAQNECIGCFNNRPHQNGEHSCGTNKNVIIIKSQLDSILNEMDEDDIFVMTRTIFRHHLLVQELGVEVARERFPNRIIHSLLPKPLMDDTVSSTTK